MTPPCFGGMSRVAVLRRAVGALGSKGAVRFEENAFAVFFCV